MPKVTRSQTHDNVMMSNPFTRPDAVELDEGICCFRGCDNARQTDYELPVDVCDSHVYSLMCAVDVIVRNESRKRYEDANPSTWPNGFGVGRPRVVEERKTNFDGHPPVVYYLMFADRIKIGTSTNLQARLKSIPHDRLLATEPGGYCLEAQRHAQFARANLRGEWFRKSPDLLAHIGTLMGMGKNKAG